MSRYIGYVWPGMRRISYKKAEKLLRQGEDVYRLYDDNSESQVENLSELDRSDSYGVEFGDSFTFARYAKSNADSTGFVCFSHGTAEPEVLLELADEFFEVYRESVSESVKATIDRTRQYLRERTVPGDDDANMALWEEAAQRINDLIPDGWQFGNFRNSGMDYGFIRE